MNIDTLKRLIGLVVFAIVQVLILNRVHLFGVATPLLCVYFVLQYRLGEPKWALLLWAFCIGNHYRHLLQCSGSGVGIADFVGSPATLFPQFVCFSRCRRTSASLH